MDIVAGDGYEKLCPFLDKAPPDKPFPRLNTGAVGVPVPGGAP